MEELAHSTIGASSAHLWMTCPASVRLKRLAAASGVQTNVSTPAAEEGTRAHAALALALETDCDVWDLPAGMLDNDEMAEHVQTTLGLLRGLPRGIEFVETRVSLAHLHPAAFGTCDFAHLDDDGLLSVIDFKYGKGIEVHVEDNPQLQYYAVGIVRLLQIQGFEVLSVRIGVIQPRRGEPGIRWDKTATMEEVEHWAERLKASMLLTDDPAAPIVVGPHCRFCPARNMCPAQAAMLKDQFSFDKLPRDMTDAEIGEALQGYASLKAYFDEVQKIAFLRLQNGRAIPGYKLVQKKGDRVWNEGAEKILVDALGETAYRKTLLSPAQVEKLPGGRKLTAQLAMRPATGFTMAPESDKRQEQVGGAAKMFAEFLNK